MIKESFTVDQIMGLAEKAEDQAIHCRRLAQSADEEEVKELLKLAEDFFKIRQMYHHRAAMLEDAGMSKI
ncbi:MAG: hypothetical protein Q8K86_08195 [Candidatus Nanopelagicaceae bacterium]|nr:hypothetical protein [Candidatus Nanopelagicaceae bacterium]